jgi:hypothetical protein
MSANLGTSGWGGGKEGSAHRGQGGSDDLTGMAAGEAVAQLEGGAEGPMPLATGVSFPGPIAQAMFYDDRPVVGAQGPVGSGKTTTVMLSRVRRARQMPVSMIDGVRHYKLIATRETYRQLWSSTIPSYLETIPKSLGTWSGGQGAPVQHLIPFEDEFGPIQWIAEFMAFGDDVVASMRGLQTVDLWLNEADTNPQDVLLAGIGRIGRWPDQKHFRGYPARIRAYGQVVCDFNAPDRDNWTHGVFHDLTRRKAIESEFRAVARLRIEGELREERPDATPEQRAAELDARMNLTPSFIGFHNQPGGRDAGAENLANLAPGYYATQVATMKLAGRGDMIARLIDNRITFLRAGDPVFRREFNPQLHVSIQRLELLPDLPLLIGLDQGFLGAAVIAQLTRGGCWRVLAELMFPKERLMAREFGNRLRDLLDARFPGHPVGGAWGDMAGEHGASQAADENDTWNRLVGKAAGFVVKPQRIGSNRIQPRLEAVRSALEFLHAGEPGLLIHGPACPLLHAGFEARYVWTDEVNASGDRRKVPDKRIPEANLVDALQYLLLGQVRGDGMSPNSFAAPRRDRREGAPRPGLTTGFDVTNPYGRRA